MTDLKIDLTTGDLAIENGELVDVEDAEAIRQHVVFRLRTALGETPYGRNIGTPWLQIIFKDGTSTESIRFILEQRVATTPGVTSAEVDPLELDAQTRAATVRGRASTINGPITFEVAVLEGDA